MANDNHGPFCAHIHVVSSPIVHGDGSKSDRWVCLGCNAYFMPVAWQDAFRPAIVRRFLRWIDKRYTAKRLKG